MPPAAARNPTVRLAVLSPRLTYRHDLDLVGLAHFSQTFETAPEGGTILGLTRRNDELSVQVRALVQRLADGRNCVWVEDVEARIGEPQTDVYVAANYPVGSCEYNVVLGHENEHVAINRAVVQAYGPRIGAQIREVVRRHFPMITAEPNVTRRLPNMLMQAVQPTVDAMLRELRDRNGVIDTPENYRRTTARCTNWFPRGTRLPARPD